MGWSKSRNVLRQRHSRRSRKEARTTVRSGATAAAQAVAERRQQRVLIFGIASFVRQTTENAVHTISRLAGGEGGIRTHGTVARTPHFECGAFDHSATSPLGSRAPDRTGRGVGHGSL